MNERDTFFDGGQEWEITEVLREAEGQDADGWLTNWLAVEAKNEDADKKFFVMEEYSGYADWGPLDTPREAIEWLIHKLDDVEEEDDEDDEDTFTVESHKVDMDEDFDTGDVEIDDSFITGLSCDCPATEETEKEDERDEKPPQTPEENGLASTLNKLVVGEWDTIDDYNAAIQQCKDLGFDDLIPSLEDIVREEHVHVGQLQELLKTISTNTNAIAQGEEEGAKQIDGSEDGDESVLRAEDSDAFVDASDFVEID